MFLKLVQLKVLYFARIADSANQGVDESDVLRSNKMQHAQ